MNLQNRFSRTVPMKWFTLVTLIVLVAVNVLSNFIFIRFDWTSEGQYSISDATKNLLGKLEDTVTLKVYMNSDLPPQFLPIRQYVSDLLSEYQAYSGARVSVQFVDPFQDEKAKEEATKIGIQEVRMQVREQDSLSVKQGYLGMGIFYKDKTEGIPLIGQEQLPTFEYDLSSLILKMTLTETPMIGFLQGHDEPELGDVYSNPAQSGAPYALIAQVLRRTYRVIPVSIADGLTLDDLHVLVVAGPRRDLTPRDLFEIDQYLLRGGKAIFLLDGVDQTGQALQLYPIDGNALTALAPLGVTVKKNLVLDQQADFGQFSEGPGRFFILPYPPFIRFSSENFAPHPIVAKLKSFVLRFVSEIEVREIDGITAVPFIRTSSTAWTQDPPFELNPSALPPAPSMDQRSQKIIGVELKGQFPRISDAKTLPPRQRWVQNKKADWILEAGEKDVSKKKVAVIKKAKAEARIMVVSDADFVKNQSIQGDEAALTLFLNMIDSLALGDDLLGIRAKALSGAKIQSLENSQRTIMKVLGMVFVPIMLSVYGVMRLWMRRRGA